MSKFVGLGKGVKYAYETLVPKISKNLTKLRKIKDEGFKSIDDQTKGTSVPNQKKSEIKKSFSEKISNIINPVEKAKGGRVGLKRGTPKRQTNIQKIKKTFGPKNLGMQSVIYGLDKNPKITAADPKAKFIATANKKNKKKVI
jgi:hypothetical protein|tara:strand:+ start:185 stop:613 length:429 start_codon:yes stop_codon:yes gene_type:complete